VAARRAPACQHLAHTPLTITAPAVAAARFDRGYVCNHSDDSGRYSYAAQPGVCRWNCEKLAEALAPVLPVGRARAELDTFDCEYDRCGAMARLQVGCSMQHTSAAWQLGNGVYGRAPGLALCHGLGR